MPQPPNGAAQGAQAQGNATPNDAASSGADALSADDIRAIVAEQVRAALDPKALSSAIAPVVNAAVTNHLKRTGPQQSQQAEQSQQAQSAQQQPPHGEQASRVDPQIAKMREELAKLREQGEKAEAARREIEQRAQRESARRTLADALSAKGVTGARQRAVIADLESRGAFKLEEDGSPSLTVARVRVKGSRATELVHRSLAEAVDDWAQTDDAKEFLPAPSGGVQPPAGRGGARMRAGEQPPQFNLDDEDGAIKAALHILDNT